MTQHDKLPPPDGNILLHLSTEEREICTRIMGSRKLSSLEEALKYALNETHRSISQTEGMSSIEEGIKAALADQRSVRIQKDDQTGDIEARITLRLHPEAVKAIEEIMENEKLPSMAEAVRRSICDTLFFSRQQNEGWRVLLNKGNEYRTVDWKGR